MNYYERHLGDYAKDTAHLSIMEHGVYTLLLDRYYSTEQGIPEAQAHRISRARSKEEKQAVDAVLDEFFTLINGIWINNRVEEEITKAQSKIKTAQENGKRGGRPKKNQNETNKKPTGFSTGFENETQVKAHQTPDTRHQSPVSFNKTHTENLNVVGDLQPGRVCEFLTEQGIVHTNPMHADLIQALQAGAIMSDFSFAATEAKNKNAKNPFPYTLKIVLGIIEDRKNAKPNSTKTRQPQVNSDFAEKYAGLG